MSHTCPRCGGEIRPQSASAFTEVCGKCGQEFHNGQPGRPVLTQEDWAVLKAHDASKGRCKPDGEVTDQA